MAANAQAASGVETGVRETDVRGEAAEMHLPVDQPFTPWIHDPAIFEEDEGDRTEMREVVEQDVKTIKLGNLVPPIHFGLGEAEITENYLKLLSDVLDSMRDRANVRLHFVGHADSLPLRGDLIEQYGDNVGLSSTGAWRWRSGMTKSVKSRSKRK
jgi:outer membrane protein OmpA-like peptidoglycan-associated protein